MSDNEKERSVENIFFFRSLFHMTDCGYALQYQCNSNQQYKEEISSYDNNTSPNINSHRIKANLSLVILILIIRRDITSNY